VLALAKKRGTIMNEADVFHDLGEAMLYQEPTRAGGQDWTSESTAKFIKV